MSLAQKGAFIDLLCFQWEDGSIPSDPQILKQMVGADGNTWRHVWSIVRSKFVETGEGTLVNPRLAADREIAFAKVQTRSECGKLGGRPRKQKETKSFPNGKLIESKPKAIPEPEPDIHLDKSKCRVPPSIFDHLAADMGTPDARAAWAEYEAHRKERGAAPYKGRGLATLARMLTEAGFAPKDLSALVTEAIGSNWKGLPVEVIQTWHERRARRTNGSLGAHHNGTLPGMAESIADATTRRVEALNEYERQHRT
jgi:uncharacterized protein YdaU (DUF1376 family)